MALLGVSLRIDHDWNTPIRRILTAEIAESAEIAELIRGKFVMPNLRVLGGPDRC